MIHIFEIAMRGFWPFCGTWLLTGMILYFVVNGIIKLWVRFTRMIMVLFRGWPPPHLDADGDWKPNPKTTAE